MKDVTIARLIVVQGHVQFPDGSTTHPPTAVGNINSEATVFDIISCPIDWP